MHKDFESNKIPLGQFNSAPFRAHAEQRSSSMAGYGNFGTFRPAVKVSIYYKVGSSAQRFLTSILQAQLVADQNIPGAKKRKKDAEAVEAKKKKLVNASNKPKRQSKAPAIPLKSFTIILVEGMKAVAREAYRKPNASKWIPLAFSAAL